MERVALDKLVLPVLVVTQDVTYARLGGKDISPPPERIFVNVSIFYLV